MAVKSQPEIVELHVDQLETILDKVEHKLGAEDSEPLRKLLRSHQTLTQLIQEKNISIARLRKLLFGSKTERTRDAAGDRGDPFDYLTQLQRHHERVAASPADWMPWNYQQQLASV